MCGREDISARILDLGNSWRWVVSLTPRLLYPLGKEPPMPIGKESGWAPEAVSTTWRRERSFPYRDSNSNPSVVQPVASRYTECAITVPLYVVVVTKMNYNCVLYNSDLHTWNLHVKFLPSFPNLLVSLPWIIPCSTLFEQNRRRKSLGPSFEYNEQPIQIT
jgi:hypothetical protein